MSIGVLRQPNGRLVTIRTADGAVGEFPSAIPIGAGPTNTALPTLTGTATVFSTLTVGDGTWTGADTVVRHLMRGPDIIAADIPDGYTYEAQPDDDRQTLYVREDATADGITRQASSAGLAITYTAPAATGTISDVDVDQGDPTVEIDASAYFTGGGLVYTIAGSAAVDIIDGLITISTALPVVADTVTVTATNSGGSADQQFTLDVNDLGVFIPPGPDPIELEDIVLSFRTDPYAGTGGIPAGAAVWTFDIIGGPAYDLATMLWWRGTPHVAGQGPGTGYHPCIQHPSIPNRWIARAVTPTTLLPRWRDWLQVNSSNPAYNLVGDSIVSHVIWTDEGSDPATGEFSGASDAIEQICQINGTPSALTIRRMPMEEQEEWNAGYGPGDCMQNRHAFAQCKAQPDIVYSIQDTGGVWKTTEFGEEWYLPTRFGLAAYQGLGIACDPVDPDRIFVNMGASAESAEPYQGFYSSFDGGATFGARVVAGKTNSRRGTHSAIAYSPSTIGATRAEKWMAIVDGEPFGGMGLRTDIPIIISTNGGTSWTTLATTWSQTAHGFSKYMVGCPNAEGRFYVSTSTKFLKVNNAFGSISFTTMSGSGGLPSGGVLGPAYVSADGDTVIVGVGGSGIFKTINANAASPTWSQVGSETSFTKLWVNPYDPTHMVLTYRQSSSQQTPKYSTNGGTTFTAALSSRFERRGTLSYTPLTQGDFMQVAFHSTAGRVLMLGRQTSLPSAANDYRSANYGADWELATKGFCGSNFGQRGASPSQFSPTDKNRFGMCLIDSGCRLTTNGGKWFKAQTLDGQVVGGPLSSFGVAVHPVAANKTVMVALGAQNPVLWASYDDASTWSTPANVNLGSGYTIIFSATGEYCFAGRSRSTNHGVTFAAMAGLASGDMVADICRGTGRIFALGDDNMTVKASDNNGTSWSTVLTRTSSNGVTGRRWGPFAAHPTDPNILFTKGANGWSIRKHDLTAGTSTELNIFGAGGTVPSSYATSVEIRILAIDPRDADVMYVATSDSGTPRLYYTTDGGATAWTAVSELPQVCNVNALCVSPVTGDVLFGGSNGTFVIGPPYAQDAPLVDGIPWGSFLGEPPPPGAPVNTVMPVLTGTAEVGQTLTCSTGTWEYAPLFFSYQWERLGIIWTDIAGATSNSYTLQSADGSTQVRCVVTATNADGSEVAGSAPIDVSPAPATAPVIGTLAAQSKTVGTGTRFYNVALQTTGTPPIDYYMVPRIFSTIIVDQLDGTYGHRTLYAGYPAPVVTQQWSLDGTPIGGETAATIDALTLELEGSLTVEVTATNDHGFHGIESANEDIDYSVPGIVNPVHLGTNHTYAAAAGTHNLTNPAYSAGDLILVAIGLDSGANIGGITSVVAPNGETVTTVRARFDGGAIGTGGTSIALYRYIATSSESSGANIAVTLSANDQLAACVMAIDAGTFNATTPISDVATGGSGAASAASANSPATTATNTGGLVATFLMADAVNISTTPAGWTQRVASSGGAINGHAATRDTYTTAAAAVAAATFAMSASEQYAAITAVINPASA